eukprot:3097655-Amphidinium_carterae.1
MANPLCLYTLFVKVGGHKVACYRPTNAKTERPKFAATNKKTFLQANPLKLQRQHKQGRSGI